MDKKGFTAYLESKDITATTITCYIKYIDLFFERVKKEDVQITKPDILKHLEYLKNIRQVQNNTRQRHLSALNHYFTLLFRNEQIAENPCFLLKIRGVKRKQLYNIYTIEQLDELFDNYYQLFVRNYDDSHIFEHQRQQVNLKMNRNALILSILINQGITASEFENIEIDDVDLTKATIKVRGTRQSNGRTLPLKATQIGLFIQYLQNIHPQFLEYQKTETNKLFLPLPKGNQKRTDNDKLLSTFNKLIKQVKTIDRQFINFKQVRASLITSWIKTHGLRKAQYMAGHRYISSTENYLPNNIDDLIDDINKLHPF